MKLRIFALLAAALIVSGCASEVDETATGESTKVEPPVSDSQVVQDDSTTSPPKMSAAQMLTTAASRMQRNPGSAIPTLEKVLEMEPKNREAIYMLAVATQFRGMELMQAGSKDVGSNLLLRSADLMDELKELGPLTPNEKEIYPQVLYNKACMLAVKGENDEALAVFKESLEMGFDDFETIDSDSDLDSIRDAESFASSVEAAKTQRVESAKAEARAEMENFETYPFTFALPNLDGEEIKLSDYDGKVVIVDIWGTWCPPCRQEIPHFIDLYAKHKESGFEMVGINYERVAEDKMVPTIKKYVDANNMTYPCVLGDDETREQIANFYGFPTTLFIDRQGKVRAQLVGYHDYMTLESYVSVLLEE